MHQISQGTSGSRSATTTCPCIARRPTLSRRLLLLRFSSSADPLFFECRPAVMTLRGGWWADWGRGTTCPTPSRRLLLLRFFQVQKFLNGNNDRLTVDRGNYFFFLRSSRVRHGDIPLLGFGQRQRKMSTVSPQNMRSNFPQRQNPATQNLDKNFKWNVFHNSNIRRHKTPTTQEHLPQLQNPATQNIDKIGTFP